MLHNAEINGESHTKEDTWIPKRGMKSQLYESKYQNAMFHHGLVFFALTLGQGRALRHFSCLFQLFILQLLFLNYRASPKSNQSNQSKVRVAPANEPCYFEVLIRSKVRLLHYETASNS